MKQEHAAGGVVYSYDPAGNLLLALILDKHGNWGLPKGHLEHGETSAQAARREIAEETGLKTSIGALVQRIEYPVFKRNEWRHKSVDYFLAHSTYEPLTPQTDEGIGAARWLPPAEAIDMTTIEAVREVVQRGLAMLHSGQD